MFRNRPVRLSTPAPRCCAPSRLRRSGSGMAARFAPSARPIPMSYAALDLGTNNCRLLIARRSGRRVPRRRCVLADRPARRGARRERRAVRGGDGAHDRGAADLRRQDRSAQGLDRPLCRDRGVPARRQLPRLPGAGARRDRDRDRDHLDRRGGAAGRNRLRAAAAPAFSLCDRVRYRRRLDRDRLAAP